MEKVGEAPHVEASHVVGGEYLSYSLRKCPTTSGENKACTREHGSCVETPGGK